MKMCFISGPVTGLDYSEVVKNFNAAEQKLLDNGYKVMNPVNFVPAGEDWKKAMRRCLVAISKCDAIYLLKGTENSTGSQMEIDIAIALEFEILFEGLEIP